MSARVHLEKHWTRSQTPPQPPTTLRPAGPLRRASDFEYSKSVVENAQGTVGYISAGRFLGNDGVDFVVPNYDKGYLDFFTYAQGDDGGSLRGAVAAEA